MSAAGFVRSDFSATIVLADAHLVAADLEQACVTALRVPTADELKCADDGVALIVSPHTSGHIEA